MGSPHVRPGCEPVLSEQPVWVTGSIHRRGEEGQKWRRVRHRRDAQLAGGSGAV